MQTEIYLPQFNRDTCEAGVRNEFTFDLTPLAEYYNDAFDARGGIIATNYGLYHFGELSCDERQAAAAYTLDQHIQDNTELPQCETADDCTRASVDTNCQYSCGAVIANSGVAELEAAITEVNAEFCVDFFSQCEPPVLPPCVPPGELTCIEGVCVESAR